MSDAGMSCSLGRRQLICSTSGLLTSLASSALFSADESAAAGASLVPHFGNAKAKNVIFLMMEGGPSHLDTFDPKPQLTRRHLQQFVRSGRQKSAMEAGQRYYVRSPFRFRRVGQSGADMAENWHCLAEVADELCFFRGCTVDSVNHPTAMYQMNCGNRFGGDPGLGAWICYGLGSMNQNLPGFIVLPEVSYPQGGAANWGNGFLPSRFQGTPLRARGSAIPDLSPPRGVTPLEQRKNLDLLARLNQKHAEQNPGNSELQARMAGYELAFRMQAEVPELLDLSGETRQVLQQYGVGQQPTDAFGRKCLLARRLVEQGVRFVQLYSGSWDSHDYIERAHGNLIAATDRPIAGLIADLRQRGLLDSTLVVWCGEFGRTPDNGIRQGTAWGRDHNPNAMTIWLAGGGCRAGSTIGATDELGMEAVECRAHVRDLHVTLLRLLGLDVLSRRALQAAQSVWREGDRAVAWLKEHQ
jgi:hypothetical protein